MEFSQSLQNSEHEPTTDSEGGDTTCAPAGEVVSGIMEQLLEEREDWFNDLSGGQRSKVELVRKVFLQDECPHILLIDKTMAPLNPLLKSLVMSKLKGFYVDSVVIAVYHTVVSREQEGEEGETIKCVPSNDFFNSNIHVENQMINLHPGC